MKTIERQKQEARAINMIAMREDTCWTSTFLCRLWNQIQTGDPFAFATVWDPDKSEEENNRITDKLIADIRHYTFDCLRIWERMSGKMDSTGSIFVHYLPKESAIAFLKKHPEHTLLWGILGEGVSLISGHRKEVKLDDDVRYNNFSMYWSEWFGRKIVFPKMDENGRPEIRPHEKLNRLYMVNGSWLEAYESYLEHRAMLIKCYGASKIREAIRRLSKDQDARRVIKWLRSTRTSRGLRSL
jgi:hypothetical protein